MLADFPEALIKAVQHFSPCDVIFLTSRRCFDLNSISHRGEKEDAMFSLFSNGCA